ncbi:MAG: hypothetical protein U0835_11280 [Isosphaeraceae bacterium]
MSGTELDEPRTGSERRPESRPAAPPAEDAPGFGRTLIVWMLLTVALNGLLWTTGFRTNGLGIAVEQGAARAEATRIGEASEDQIRKAVHTQHDTLSFWTVLALIGDFVCEPALLGLRALAMATAFAAAAALVGRPIGYDRALAECAVAQGFWVLGLGVRAALMIGLRRTEVDTSALLLMPPGSYPAPMLLGLSQLDAFALLGWWAVGRGGVRRGQVSVLTALALCLMFWVCESAVRVALGSFLGASMRLSLLP